MSKTIRILSLLALLLSAVSAFASEPAGTRVQSLGGCGVALPEEAATLYWNPAGLFYQNRLAMDFTFQFDDLDWSNNWGFSYLNYSRSLHNGAGLGIYRQAIVSDDPLQEGNAIAVLVTTVYPTPWGIPIGASLKYISERWADQGRENLFSADLGTMVHVKQFYLGLCVQSVTQPSSAVFPYQIRGGLSWRLFNVMTLAAQAAAQTWDQVETLRYDGDLGAGLEVSLLRNFALQGGWAQKPGEKYWTGGFGLATKEGHIRLYLGYHWHPDQDMDDRAFLSYNYNL